ncbi:unnamed protein product [Hymenolepis diminuta]|uniref:Uncharacterized protein n=1 Tax=Hymenolepis diminuta TaxID=6216 RepID=A0A0R3SZ94_HYMDI|nr:unnamed protein product [Hymenolepis diminuta]
MHPSATIFEATPRKCTQATARLMLERGQVVFRRKRSVSIAAMKMEEDEFVHIEETGALRPVTYSKWAAPVAVTRKANASTRICPDFSTEINSL